MIAGAAAVLLAIGLLGFAAPRLLAKLKKEQQPEPEPPDVAPVPAVPQSLRGGLRLRCQRARRHTLAVIAADLGADPQMTVAAERLKSQMRVGLEHFYRRAGQLQLMEAALVRWKPERVQARIMQLSSIASSDPNYKRYTEQAKLLEDAVVVRQDLAQNVARLQAAMTRLEKTMEEIRTQVERHPGS